MKNPVSALALVLPIAFSLTSFILPAQASSAPTLDVWWPTDGAVVSGMQPFKAMLENVPSDDYSMTWSVDNGQQNQMSENDAVAPHYESDVDLSGWTWDGNGPYAVTFTASEDGSVVATQTVDISVGSAASAAAPAQQPVVPTPSTSQIDPWWPTSGVTVSGVQPFKAVVPGLDVSDYSMYWSVDGGQSNQMTTENEGGAHKEASVDVSGWDWHGNGPYQITFTAENDAGQTIATDSFPIYLSNTTAGAPPVARSTSGTVSGTVASVAPATAALETPITAAPNTTDTSGPLTGLVFYAAPDSSAATQAASWASTEPSAAAAMEELAATPTAIWLGAWDANVESTVAETMRAAAAVDETPVFVAYNIPDRDCGGYSAGGAENDASYQAWIAQVAAGVGSGSAVVILEPDGLSVTSCLSSSQLSDRETSLNSAVQTLAANSGTKVYIDAGHEDWIDPSTMASELQAAGIANAAGFSVNVSNFEPTSGEEAYGAQVSADLGGAHFVIDTSRNGAWSDGQWCNPPGMAIGQAPTTATGDALVDAFLWVKTPGESDGTCNGGPSAGDWWPSYALSLVEDSH